MEFKEKHKELNPFIKIYANVIKQPNANKDEQTKYQRSKSRSSSISQQRYQTLGRPYSQNRSNSRQNHREYSDETIKIIIVDQTLCQEVSKIRKMLKST